MKKLFSVFVCVFLLIPAVPSICLATFPGETLILWAYDLEKEKLDPQILKVMERVKEKKYEDARTLLEAEIQAGRNGTTPTILLGILLNEMGEYKQSILKLREGAAAQRRHPALNFGYCQTYRNLGMSALSLRACQIAIEQHQNSPEAHFEYAQTLAAMGDMETSNQELARAEELDKANSIYPFAQGMNYFYLNQLDSAEKAFLRVLKANPDDLKAAYQLSYLYAIQKKTDQAKTYIDQILNSGKNDPNVDSAKNLQDYINKDALDRLPGKTVPDEYHLKRSQGMYRAGKYGLSLMEIETASKLKPDDLKIGEILVGMYSILFRLPETETAVRVLIGNPKAGAALKARSYQELGDLMLLQGRLKDARKFYEQSKTQGDPNQLSEISLKEFPKEDSDALYKIDPNDVYIQPEESLNHKGEIFAFYGMHERAIAVYSMVLQMNPKSLTSKLNMATSFYHQAKYNQAIGLLEKILLSQSKHKYILAHRLLLAQAYVKKGKFKPGIKHLAQAVQSNPNVKAAIKKNPVFEVLNDEPDYQKLFQ